MAQVIITENNAHRQIGNILRQIGCSKFLLVRDASFSYLCVKEYFSSLDIPYEVFDEFTPNPRYEDVCKGVQRYRTAGCDAIVAVGGGSTLDVAKCIKLYVPMDPEKNYLQQEYADSGIPLIAMPTTAGTGSESTRFAVIYFEGEKQSVHHDSIVPNYAVLEPAVLKTLPLYQKKCTMLDALCQAIESWWSVNSTEESKGYAGEAIAGILRHWRGYIFDNTDEAARQILLAANYAGRAINITQTTAPHAMSYKLTSLYGLPHGHAVALSLPEVWDYMIAHPADCIDSRGSDYLMAVFAEIAAALGASTPTDAVARFRSLLAELEMTHPCAENREAELALLARSVNTQRLKNNPVALTERVLYGMYDRIVR